jgi:hypothetical protein
MVQRDPRQLLTAILVWACVIGGIVVFFMAVSHFGEDHTNARARGPIYPEVPLYMNPQYAYMVPPGQGTYPQMRPCRYCDGFMTPASPICPRCGRRN